MNFGNELHNLEISQRAAEKVLTILKNEFGFIDFKSTIPHTNDIRYISVVKNDLVVSIMVSTREAYNLFFYQKNKLDRKSTIINYVSKKYGLFSSEEAKYARDHYESGKKLESHSESQYFEFMRYDLNFVIKNYPQMFLNGSYLD